MESALRQLIEQQSRQTEIVIELHSTFSGDRFGHSVEIGLYRIAQEALHNAIKHAKASKVHVSLLPDGDKISLNIDDNGSGFKPQRVKVGSHGLHNMRERTQLLNGIFEINSEPGEGTSVSVVVPVSL
ncbi:MAG: hypothetical protein LH609_19170 [Rudanella sp.]|nr:hypothetical protein [Rudanella sp.]